MISSSNSSVDNQEQVGGVGQGGGPARSTHLVVRKPAGELSSVTDYIKILKFAQRQLSIESLHFAFLQAGGSTTMYINDQPFTITSWSELQFDFFLNIISKQKINRVTFNPTPDSVILQVLQVLPSGTTELSFGCCDMGNSVLAAITDYLLRNRHKESLTTFQIWDACDVEAEGLISLLSALHQYSRLSVLQIITESGISPLNTILSPTLSSLVGSLGLLEDLILNSQENGDVECAQQVIEALSIHNKIKVLDISLNNGADAMLVHLGRFLTSNSSLQRLYLWGNMFVENGLDHLVEPLGRHLTLDRLHIECTSERFSLQNCQALARIIETNKSLTEIDGVDYNEESTIDCKQAQILLGACDRNLTLSRLDFFVQDDEYVKLDGASATFSCKNDGYFTRNICSIHLNLECASLLRISRLIFLLHDLPFEVADVILQVSLPKALQVESLLILRTLRDSKYFGLIHAGSIARKDDLFSFQNLIRCCHALRL